MKRQPTPIENVYRYENGTLYYRKGKVEESLKTKDLKEASVRKQIIEDRLVKYGFQSFKATFGSLFPVFWEEIEDKYKRGKIRELTYKTYRTIFNNHLIPYFGKMKLSRFDELEWKKYLNSTELSETKNVRVGMQIFFTWARQNRQITRRFDLVVKDHKSRQRAIATTAQVKAILSHADERTLLFASCALFCGMRCTEIRTLEWRDVHLDQRYFDLLPEKVKTKRGRHVPFNEFIYRLLLKIKSEMEKQGIKSRFVFHQIKGHAINRPVARSAPHEWWKDLRATAPVLEELTYHDLRATFETHMNKRTDFTDMQKEKYAGADLKIQSQRYVTMRADDLRGIESSVKIEGLDELFTKRLASL